MDFIFQHEQYLREFDLIHSGCYSYMETHLPQLRELNIPVSFDFQMTLYWSRRCRCAVTSTSPSSHAPTTAAQTREMCNKRRPAEVALSARRVEMKARFLFDGQDWYQQAPDYVTPVDTMGAGDAFITAFICHFLAQPTGNKREAITRACKSSSFLGTNLPERRAFGYGTHY